MMKKLMMLAVFGLMMTSGMNVFAQDAAATQDSGQIAEEPKDTISIDNMDPVFYEEEATKESSNGTTYALIGGIVVVGGIAYFMIKKKKK
jgi:LPXTG-motif cell wall-anchored protein